MADNKHPYTSGGSGGIVQAVNQLRKAFPAKVTGETLKKLGIAKNNESYIINILRFINVIDAEGQKTKDATPVFSQHEDQAFAKGLAALVENAYSGLFQLHGAGAWALPADKLITFFRSTDQTSAVVGQRQAQTFQALAALSGHGEPPTPKVSVPKAAAKTTPAKKGKPPAPPKVDPQGAVVALPPKGGNGAVGLTVRVEINLPATGDQDTYDKIFKSIRENLLRGE